MPKKKSTALSLAGLDAVLQDARTAALAPDDSPAPITQLPKLLSALKAAKKAFPPLYTKNFLTPYIATLETLTPAQFATILARDPKRQGTAGLLFDIAEAILQPASKYNHAPTRAFQEFVSDLYDGFLSAEDRRGIQPPDLGVIPPLVKWGNPDSGPYTWPIDAVKPFGIKAGVVNLPPGNAAAGIVAWAALGHETAGHDILHADSGLQPEMARALQAALAPLGHGLASYWSDRIDETSSDVMGLLNLGPAAGLGLIAYFRALGAAYANDPTLRSEGPADDPHPADIVRGYLAAEVVALLEFKEAKAYATLIAKETDKDRKTIVLAGNTLTPKLARQSAQVVAKTLMQSKMKAIQNHSLGDIQGWADSDEALVNSIRAEFRAGKPAAPSSALNPTYAAHLVSAAVLEALATGKEIPQLQQLLIQSLNTLHDTNASWGPLYVEQASTIRADYMLPAAWRK